MKNAWKTFQGRLDVVEQNQKTQEGDITTIKTRTKVLERDNMATKGRLDRTGKKMEEITEDVKNMQVQIGELQEKTKQLTEAAGSKQAPPPVPPQQPDPWGEYLRRNGRTVAPPVSPPLPSPSAQGEKGESLTEDEKRTLVLGGWLRDTKRAIIEQEFADIAAIEGFKALVDTDKLVVYGPRRSVGMLKFQEREGEDYNAVRNRMWETIRFLQQLRQPLKSTKEEGEVKLLWGSFVKTRQARAKSAHVSLIRRVTIGLALDSKDANGSIACSGVAAKNLEAHLTALLVRVNMYFFLEGG
ncbi:pol, partial [Symbiodinium sp. CCMP2456]